MKYHGFLKWLAATILGFGVCYLFAAFVRFELNPGAWPEVTRVAALVLGLAISWCSACVLFDSGEGE